MFCSRCGQQYSDDKQECPICGKSNDFVKKPATVATPTAQSRELISQPQPQPQPFFRMDPSHIRVHLVPLRLLRSRK